MTVSMRARAVRLLAATLPLLAAAGCETGPPAPDYATGEILEEAISGASYVGTLPDGSAVCVYHAADGRFLGRANGLVSGEWSVREDGLCYVYLAGPGTTDCRQVALLGNRANLYFADIVIGQGHLSQGNVCA